MTAFVRHRGRGHSKHIRRRTSGTLRVVDTSVQFACHLDLKVDKLVEGLVVVVFRELGNTVLSSERKVLSVDFIQRLRAFSVQVLSGELFSRLDASLHVVFKRIQHVSIA